MSYQATSKSYLPYSGTVLTPYPNMLGQIFFPTNRTRLDGQDGSTLLKIAYYIRRVAINKRVELTIVGHADHRGNVTYNKKLGVERARSVARELKRLLWDVPKFSVTYTVSLGEEHARQGIRDRQGLATDRRVDIWDTVPDYHEPKPVKKQPKKPVQMLERLTYIKLSKYAFDPATPHPNTDPWRDVIKQGVPILLDRLLGDTYSRYGTVDMATYRKMDADYRVFDIHIKVLNYADSTASGIFNHDTTEIHYSWGKPSRDVVVRTTTKVDAMGMRSTRYHSKTLSRKEADRDVFTFPLPRDMKAY